MMDGETLKAMLGLGTATRALLADIAAAIREHTAEMRESEARIENRAAQRMEDQQVADDRRNAENQKANDARMEPYNKAMNAIVEHAERTDQRFAAMEKRIDGAGF
jgi:putative protein kinase ArgK-like GTPase of G3E family